MKPPLAFSLSCDKLGYLGQSELQNFDVSTNGQNEKNRYRSLLILVNFYAANTAITVSVKMSMLSLTVLLELKF